MAGRRKEDRKGRGHCGAGAADVSHLALAVHTHGATRGKRTGRATASLVTEKKNKYKKKHLKTLQILVFDSKRKRTSWGLLAPTVPSGPSGSRAVGSGDAAAGEVKVLAAPSRGHTQCHCRDRPTDWGPEVTCSHPSS